MGRPKGGTNVFHTKEEKLSLVLRNLAGETAASLQRETGIYHAQIHKWTKQYLEGGEDALVNKRNPIRICFLYHSIIRGHVLCENVKAQHRICQSN